MADTNDVQNVLVYVADSLRFDYLPDTVRERGVTARTISPSTFTAMSLPSMFTGLYPTNHGIDDFGQTFTTTPPFFNAQNLRYDLSVFDWPVQLFNINATQSKRPGTDPELPAEPFTYVYHDVGGHMPYGHDYSEFETLDTFFDMYSDKVDSLPSLYEQSVEKSTETFTNLIKSLEEHGILSETLVVFTSDHGELLGECGGVYGHGLPLVDTLVTVPTVFLGAGLPSGKTLGSIASGTDIAPTALGALGKEVPGYVDGINLWDESRGEDDVVHAEVKQTFTRELPFDLRYDARSVWDADGGIVFHGEALPKRILMSILTFYTGNYGKLIDKYSLTGIRSCLTASTSNAVAYGSPGFSETDARDRIHEEWSDTVSQLTVTEQEPDRDQLRQLGYL
jgi:arylsulfatase A-like enzyme